MRVSDAHAARDHLHDLPRGVAELKHVARVALDREVFVQRPDKGVFRLQHHAIVGDFRNCATRGECEHPGAAPPLEYGVHLISMHERRASSAFRGEPV